MSARALMLLGTASHVGKSVLTAAFCRIFKQAGYKVAPFKAQNMALNSAATLDGFEIGRAQAMQAEAAGIAPTVDMNPILIKPSSDIGAQVIVRGRIWGQVTAADYHRRRVEELFPLVIESYQKLAVTYDIVVLEGAGSPAEINLKDRDIVNMRMAEAANAICLLVGDIDRGGVFASLLGTLELLEQEERKRIHGFIINKFRGDKSLLDPGIRMIEDRIGKPCVGVIPYLRDIGIEEEDNVAVEEKRGVTNLWEHDSSVNRQLRVGVIALPHLSNFTDFDPLEAEPSISLCYIRDIKDMGRADLFIIPGTKQTIDDLRWLKHNGFDKAIVEHAEQKIIIGICGGMQILGREVKDPHGIEGGGQEPGLGLLPICTILNRDKVTQQTKFHLINPELFGQRIQVIKAEGYEIHVGATEYGIEATALFHSFRNGQYLPVLDGAVSHNGKTIGTYIHGIFNDDNFRHVFINAARSACKLEPTDEFIKVNAEREGRFNKLAAHVKNAIDQELLMSCLNLRLKC
jgi:adenosylcobyric acid synthase